MGKVRAEGLLGRFWGEWRIGRSHSTYPNRHHWRVVLAAIASCISLSLLGQAALAEMKQLRSTIRPSKDQTFAELMQRAEFVAEKLVQQTFSSNPKVTEVSVTVLGERNGQEAPLLFSSISRANWQKTRQIRPWTTYFNNFSVALLGYRKPPTPPTPVSSAPTVPAPEADPSNPNPLASPLNPGETSPGLTLNPGQSGSTAQNSPAVAPATPTNATPAQPTVVPTSLPTSANIPPSRARVQDDPAFRDD